MKIIDVKVPALSDIEEVPSFKRRGSGEYCLNSLSTSLNYNLLTYVDKNGLIVSTGKKYSGGPTKLIIDLQIDIFDDISVGNIIDYNDIPFEVIEGNKAISLQEVSIDNLFVEQYTTSDPNKGNDLLAGYNVNEDALLSWRDKDVHIIECEKYDSKEHVNTEKELFRKIIKYSYKNQAEKEKRFYGQSSDAWFLTEEKMNKELKTPNIFVSDLIAFFIDAINNKYSIEDCAFLLLKRNKQFGYNDDRDNLTMEKQELLQKEIEKIQDIYLLCFKYVELNATYDNYLTDVFQRVNDQIQL